MKKLLIALFAACMSTAFVVGSAYSAEDKKEASKKDDDKKKKGKKDEKK